MTSLFEPTGPPLPPHTRWPAENPWVWVQHGPSWHEGILWCWTWDPNVRAHRGFVDYWTGTVHRLHYVHEDQIRAHRLGPPALAARVRMS